MGQEDYFMMFLNCKLCFISRGCKVVLWCADSVSVVNKTHKLAMLFVALPMQSMLKLKYAVLMSVV